MPLPEGGSTAWPPHDMHHHIWMARAWAAWWSGDMAELIATSATDMEGVPQIIHPQERRFNLSGLIRRRFWQRRGDIRDGTSATRPLHAPLGGDIAATSADLLFGELPSLEIPPTLTAQGKPKRDRQRDAVEERLEDLIDQTQLWSRLLEAAEACAATGGVYLRALWDKEIADHPLSTVVDQRQAIPDFRFGKLLAVTFAEDVLKDHNTIWRHLERHEPGVVLHGLYEGTETTLGAKRPLSALPQTAMFPDQVPLPKGLPRPLIVSYVPNVLPNRRGNLPIGRSDYAGSEGQLDSLDEVWTSLMRDFRLGQARIVVPLEFMQAIGTNVSDGKMLDVDTELFTGLNIGEVEKLNDPLKMLQPQLRVEQHAAAMTDLVRNIVSAAGYSPQTFGLDIHGQAETGTALRIREKKTLHTLARKRGYWTAGVVEHAENLLALDQLLFGGPGVLRPKLTWPELDDEPAERAQTTSVWRSAQAMSIVEAVKAKNPHWDEDQVDEEVARIQAETAAVVPPDLLPLEEDTPGEDTQPGDGKQPTTAEERRAVKTAQKPVPTADAPWSPR